MSKKFYESDVEHATNCAMRLIENCRQMTNSNLDVALVSMSLAIAIICKINGRKMEDVLSNMRTAFDAVDVQIMPASSEFKQ